MLIFNNGTPRNTIKKIGVPSKNRLLLYYENTHTYIGTPEHRNTHV